MNRREKYKKWTDRTIIERIFLKLKDIILYELNPVFRYKNYKAYKQLMKEATKRNNG